MASIGYATLSVIPSAAGFSSALSRDITPGLSGVGRNAGKVLGLGLLAGAAVVVAGIGAIIKTGVGEAMDASAGTAQLAAGIKSTGNAAGVSVDKLNALASSIQGYSGQTDDSIVQSEALLLTFTNIKNGVGEGSDIFDRATVATANMAARMGGDAAGSAIQLGKALNDPIAGMASLGRMGVQFTAAQKDTIAALVESGDVMGAQKVILAELETQFGGAAAAAGESLPGKLAIAKRSFEDVSQAVVEGLLPVVLPGLTSIGTTITSKVIPAVTGFIQGFKDGEGPGGKFRDILSAVRGGVLEMVNAFKEGEVTSDGFAGVMGRVGLAARVVAGFITGTLVPAIGSIAAWISGTGVPALRDFATWISKNRTGLSALASVVGGAVVAYKGFQAVNAIMRTAHAVQLGFAAASYGSAGASYASGTAARIGAIGYAFMNSTLVKGVAAWWANTAAQLANSQGGLLVKAAIIAGAVATGIATAAQWLWNAAMTANPIGIIIVAIGALVGALIWVATQTTFFQDVWKAVADWFTVTVPALWNSILAWTTEKWNAITAFFSGIVTSIRGFFQGVWDFLVTVFSYTPLGLIVNNWDAIVGFFTGLPGKIGSAVAGMWDGITNSFKSALNTVIRAWNNFQITLGGGTTPWGAEWPSFTLETPNISPLASGALITNPALALLGESGSEAVLPFSRVDEFAAMVARQMGQMDLGPISGRGGVGRDLIDYDRLAAAMSRVNLTLDGRRVSQSADAWIGASIR